MSRRERTRRLERLIRDTGLTTPTRWDRIGLPWTIGLLTAGAVLCFLLSAPWWATTILAIAAVGLLLTVRR